MGMQGNTLQYTVTHCYTLSSTVHTCICAKSTDLSLFFGLVLSHFLEQIVLTAKLDDYFFWSNKSNIKNNLLNQQNSNVYTA